MDKIIRIQCPNCGAILSLKNFPGLMLRTLICPKCNKANKIIDYYIPQNPFNLIQEEGATSYQKSKLATMKPGRLLDMNTGIQYQLSEGCNIVGRKSSSYAADVQIVTSDLHVSRQHILINVGRSELGFYYLISNAKNINKTLVNGQIIGYTDQIQLAHGDVIQIGEVKLKLELL